jgi:hypothetical protein
VARTSHGISLRNSAALETILAVSTTAWRDFVSDIKRGTFDRHSTLT